MPSLYSASMITVGMIAVIGLVSLGFASVLRQQVLAAPEGTPRMRQIAHAIQEGAAAYLNRMLRTLVVFAALVFALLFLLPGDAGIRFGRSVFFLLGAGSSAAIGYLGMRLAVRANVRVAAAAPLRGGKSIGARLAFRTGGVVGMSVVGLGLLGAAAVVLIYRGDAPAVLEGFGFGAAMLAMFMRVGGGIFTKAADVGADLVGKVEKGIPEDDPRNAATIADNVGDNVGDCAGMAADLFESYAVTLVAALILGKVAFGEQGLVFPLLVMAVGAVTGALGVLITRVRNGDAGLPAIYRGFYLSALAGAALATLAAFAYLPSSFAGLRGVSAQLAAHTGDPRVVAAVSVLIGVLLAGVVLRVTGYFTGTASKPTIHVARTSLTGPATVVLSGIGVGLESAVYTAGIVAAAICAVFLLSGGSFVLALFLIALAGCGLLTTVGVIVAMDTFGPVTDNAQGIAQMSGEGGPGARVLTELDAVGNTTKAMTKGIAITSAVLAATALFGAYADTVRQAMARLGEAIDSSAIAAAMGSYEVISPITLVGVILGAATVFLFSGLLIDAVTRAAGSVVFEVRRQFRLRPGIMTGAARPDYGRVVDICTRDSLRELVAPGLLAAMAPVAVGFGLGVGPLAGFLAGSIAAGLLLALFLANAGGTWDNAKKLVEDGRYGGAGSPAHAAAVIGDTVGDPFKDTAGPALNPLIKVMNLLALLIAPAVVRLSAGAEADHVARVAIATTAGVIALGAVLVSRLRAARVDSEARLERETRLG